MNTEIIENAKALVREKYRLDLFLQHYKDQTFLFKLKNRLLGFQIPKPDSRTIPAIWPYHFIRNVLPFSEAVPDKNKGGALGEVDPFLVIGATFNIYKKKTQEEQIKKINWFNSSEGRSVNMIKYYKIGDLPLYIASEGKNRVLMFQNNNKPIVAYIHHYLFPKPEEIILHKTYPSGIYAISCSNPIFYTYDNYSYPDPIILPFPELILPLLQSYGIKKVQTLFFPFAIWKKRSIIKEVTGRTLEAEHLVDT